MSVALVTGASSGIGEALARVIATDGHDLVLVARRADQLAALAENLRQATGRRMEVLAADLLDGQGVARVEARLRSAHNPVDQLVNNAGAALYGPFADADAQATADLFALHVLAPMRLMHAALSGAYSSRNLPRTTTSPSL